MNTRLIVLGILCFIVIQSSEIQGQQTEQYSLFGNNLYAVNPAYAGFDGSLSINANLRTQWNDIDGNPTSQHISAHAPIYAWGGGIGVSLDNESLGAWQQTEVAFSYNFVRPLSFGLFSFGGRIGWMQAQLDGLRLRTVDGTYEGPVIDHADPILPLTRVSSSTYIVDAGIFLAIESLEIGAGYQNINEGTFTLNENNIVNARLERTLYLHGRYIYQYNNDYRFIPFILAKTSFTQTQIEGSISAEYQNAFTLGAGYRGFSSSSSDAIILLFGAKVADKLWIRYAYDLGRSDISTAGGGSHELGLNYNLGKSLRRVRKDKIIYNPRFLE